MEQNEVGVFHWILSPPERLGKKDDHQVDQSLKCWIESKHWDVECLTNHQINVINMLINESIVWNALSGVLLDTPVVTKYRTVGTARLPFGGKSLLEHYKEDFGVDLEDKFAPIVMDKLVPHAIEVLWMRTTLTTNTEEEEASDEEEEPDEFIEAEDVWIEEEEFDFENEYEFRR